MDLKYSNACKEVVVLFDCFLDRNDLSKIPEKQMEYLKENANQKYTYIVDKSKTLEEQKISKEAKAIIVNLYKKYFITNEQKQKVNEIIYILDRQKNIEKTNNSMFNNIEKDLKYKNNIKDKVEIKANETVENEEKALVKSESIWKKIANKILKFFHLK